MVQSPVGSLLLPLGPDAHTTVYPPRGESLFPLVLSKFCNQILLAFKVWFSGNSSSCCWTPRLGSLMWATEPPLQWVDFCSIIVLQFVSSPPSGYGIWFYCDCAPPTISLQLLLCVCMWGIFFGEFQCLPVDDCSAVSCGSGVLTRGSESTSFYSAILNQSPPHYFLNIFFCVFLSLPSETSIMHMLGCFMMSHSSLKHFSFLHWTVLSSFFLFFIWIISIDQLSL